MGKIICICEKYEIEDRDRSELLVSYGIDENTEKIIVLQNEHPSKLGAKFDHTLGEYVIQDL